MGKERSNSSVVAWNDDFLVGAGLCGGATSDGDGTCGFCRVRGEGDARVDGVRGDDESPAEEDDCGLDGSSSGTDGCLCLWWCCLCARTEAWVFSCSCA